MMSDETAIIYLTYIEQDLKSELSKEAVRHAIRALKDRNPVKTTEQPTPPKTVIRPVIRPEFLELLRFLQKEFPKGIQTFFTRNLVGDAMCNIYDKDNIQVDLCPYWSYIEIFGLKEEEKDFLKRHFDK